MTFPLARFQEFCGRLTIDSRERGQIKLTWKNLLSTQKYFIEEVAKGLDEGIHFFVILKGRQEGITTICAALDLFWHYEYEGMQGTFASHNEEARDKFRSMLDMYHKGLDPKYRVSLVNNNRYFLSWKNRSRLSLQIGGGAKSKRSGGKGRGSGYTFIHATECSSWEDEEALASILASLAQINPLRLQIFESTARGANLFKDIWDDAKDAVTQRAIFIGWWLNEMYAKEKGSNEYRVYWEGSPAHTAPEAEWVRDVKALYDYDITPEQIAWWRWMKAEIIHDEDLMMQEYPPTEHHAFILSGKNFFSIPKVEELRSIVEQEPEPSYWRFTFGDVFIQSNGHPGIKVDASQSRLAHLAVWEEPTDKGIYSIGADPAYGSATWADRSVVEVYRCYADRFEQVAEFCTPEITTRKFAWVVVYLAGLYRNSMLNLEINGPGEDVLGEINNMRAEASILGSGPVGKALKECVGHMRYFLYKKLDSPFGGNVYHWKTTSDSKDRMFNSFRNLVDTSECVIHSPKLLDEMDIIVREDDGFLGASGRGKDDCTVASAIAGENYVRYIRLKLKQMNMTWAKERMEREAIQKTGAPETAQQAGIRRSVGTFLGDIGIKYGEPQ